METRLGAVAVLAFALAAPSPAGAQSYSDVPDSFRLEIGGFRVGADTKLALNRGGASEVVDFESDLDLEETGNRAFLEVFWRPGRRHLLSVAYQRFDREGSGRTLQRDITWGGVVYPVGFTATAETGADYVSGAYRFAVYRNDRFEIGPALGIGYLTVDASITATATAGGASQTLSQSAEYGTPTGNLGAYFHAWLAPRVLLRGDYRYIIVKPEDSEASIVDARAGLVFHPWPRVGIGLQYVYTKFRYDRGVLSSSLGGSLRYAGGQIVAGFAF